MLIVQKAKNFILGICLLVLLSACGTSTSIESVKDPSYNKSTKDASYNKKIKKITTVELINLQQSNTFGTYNASFSGKFITQLSKCNIEGTFEPGGMLLNNAQKSQIVKNVKSHQKNVDAILTISDQSIQTVSINQAPGQTTGFTMIFTLIDPATEKNIWKAEMSARLRYTNAREAGETMAKDIYKKLSDDGILPPCADVN